MKHLLIGGPRDGESVATDKPEIRVPIHAEFGARVYDCTRTEYYHRETFVIGEARTVYFIYRHQSLTIEEAFHRLLDHYKLERT